MDRIGVECLCCGQHRIIPSERFRVLHTPECPSCGYLGWAPTGDLDEPARRQLRSRPPEQRRLRAVG